MFYSNRTEKIHLRNWVFHNFFSVSPAVILFTPPPPYNTVGTIPALNNTKISFENSDHKEYRYCYWYCTFVTICCFWKIKEFRACFSCLQMGWMFTRNSAQCNVGSIKLTLNQNYYFKQCFGSIFIESGSSQISQSGSGSRKASNPDSDPSYISFHYRYLKKKLKLLHYYKFLS